MRYVVLVILILACLVLGTAKAQTPYDRESLRGLPGVRLLIESLESDAKADGLSEDSIRTSVELILRSSGIRIFSRAEEPFNPHLYVRVSTLREANYYATCVLVALDQTVYLKPDPSQFIVATTWQDGKLGSVGRKSIANVIPGAIEPLVKQFANDFLAVNPK